MRPALACVAGAVILAGTALGEAAVPGPADPLPSAVSLCETTIDRRPPDPTVDRWVILWPDDAQRLADLVAQRLGETGWRAEAAEIALRASGDVLIGFYRGNRAQCVSVLLSAPWWREVEERFRAERGR